MTDEIEPETPPAQTKAADAPAPPKPETWLARRLRARFGRKRKPHEGPDVWDAAADWLGKHGALPVLALITIIIGIVHAGVFRGETAGDDLTFHFAESARLADCLRVGDFDFWNPSANAGYASIYYYQAIPQLASAIPAAVFGHHLFWFELSVWLPLAFAPAAAYRGMRLMGATPWQAVIAALAVGFMNGESRWGSGNAGTFQVGLYTQTWALAALPLALGHAARWITEKQGLAPAIAWGAFVGLCHPFAVVCLGVGLIVSLIAKLVPSLAPLRWPAVLGRLLIMMGLVLMLLIPTRWLPNDQFEWIAGPLLCATGLALPMLVRKDTQWILPKWREVNGELLRTLVLGALMVLAWMPIWLPLLTDYEGFGGFPHRVNDEVGPGFYGLAAWYAKGAILDWSTMPRLAILTMMLPLVLLFTRAKYMRWLWPPALFYALLLGLGPHVGRTQDDLLPAVRFLGAMQTVLALGIGAGAVLIGEKLWHLPVDAWFKRPTKPGEISTLQYGTRTAIAALAAAIAVLVIVPGSRALGARVHVLGDFPGSHRDELLQINEVLAKQPPGRKQVAAGAENHWWNLLSYAYVRVPALLQMGGGGLQASPNYDFLWSGRDLVKNAWLYDAPYVVFMRALGSKLPVGDTITRTENYEIRGMPTDGLVSPVQVIGELPVDRKQRKKIALDWLRGDGPMKDRVLAYAGSGPAGEPPDAKTLRAWHQDSPGDEADIVAEVEANKPSTVVVRESWHPRWHAFIDGEEVTVRRVTPDFPAVDMPVGKHTLEMRFQRPWWLLACWLLWPGTPFGAWWFLRWRRRRADKPALPEARARPAQ